MTITTLDPADHRTFAVAVAGPAALLVAKLHKIAERASERDRRRLDDKDALDVLRLLRAIHTSAFADTFVRLLHADVASDVTREAMVLLRDLFAARGGRARKWRCVQSAR